MKTTRQTPSQRDDRSDAARASTGGTAVERQTLMDQRPVAHAHRAVARSMNDSPSVLQQRALSDAIHGGAHMVAQRRAMDALFAGAAHRPAEGAEGTRSSLIQRKAQPDPHGLPAQLKSGIESLSGMSMDHVTVHYNSSKPAQLQAHAYAQGHEIHLGPGQERHLPHEAWHVVQQAQGRVRPTLQMKAVGVNDDPGLEAEADAMGARALSLGPRVTQRFARGAEARPASHAASVTYQLKADVYSKAHYANPSAYLATQFPQATLNEDAGSGGILDAPVQKLVLDLAIASRKELYMNRLIEIGGEGVGLAASLQHSVYDRASAKTWVVENTLGISNVAPSFLTIENVLLDDAPTGPAHVFHRDRGKVVLTDQALIAQKVNSAPERTARLKLANGPFGTGWVRGHYGVLNLRHRFIEHIHVDKGDGAGFDIYNADAKTDGDTAASFNLANRANLNGANDSRADQAAIAAEGEAKRVAWEQYEQTLPPETDGD